MFERYQLFMTGTTDEIFWHQIDLEKLMAEVAKMKGKILIICEIYES
jgi:hypothetical protein